MWTLSHLPTNKDLETKPVLKKLASAHRALAELKGIVSSIPNEEILLNTLVLQEAKDSSEVENIITTHDELYKSELTSSPIETAATKEVQNYIQALKTGFHVTKSAQLITNKHILQIQEILEANQAGFRKVPGTSLKNQRTGEVVYTPPQHYDEIKDLMQNLEQYINVPEMSAEDVLVKMAVIHFQFESIHPFYDGNGRTGRIINILYLTLNDLLPSPILYLSRYITQNKDGYYRELQAVRDSGNWENWILYMLDAVEKTAGETIVLVGKIKGLMQTVKNELRENYKFYSQDLLNNLFKHPYTKIEFLQRDLGISRVTAAAYLNQLAENGLLEKQRLGKSNYYINKRLFNILTTQKSLRQAHN